MTVQDRVAAGAAFLDEKRPGWFNEIDNATLDIASAKECVCGQLFGSYSTGIGTLGASTHSVDYGFVVTDTTREELNIAWCEAITARKTKIEERELVAV